MASKNPQIRAIELEAARLANADGKTSLEERFKVRNELRAAQGLKPEKRKLGGVAGVVDRNRNFVGNLAKNVAPLLTLLPGVGVPLAAAVGAGGRAIQKGANIGDIAKQGLSTATMAGGVAGAASGLNAATAAGKGVMGQVAGAGAGAARGAMDPFKRPLASTTAAGGLKALPAPGARTADTLPGLPDATPAPNGGSSGPWWDDPAVLDAAKALPGAAGAAGAAGAPGAAPAGGNWWDKVKDVAGTVAGTVTGGRGADGLLDAGMLGLAGAQAVNAANASARARGLSDDAIALAKKNWGEGEALRTAGRSGMLSPVRRDLSSTYADPTNPFASPPAGSVTAPAPTPGAPPPVAPAAAPVPAPVPRRLPPAAPTLPVSTAAGSSARRAYR